MTEKEFNTAKECSSFEEFLQKQQTLRDEELNNFKIEQQRAVEVAEKFNGRYVIGTYYDDKFFGEVDYDMWHKNVIINLLWPAAVEDYIENNGTLTDKIIYSIFSFKKLYENGEVCEIASDRMDSIMECINKLNGILKDS